MGITLFIIAIILGLFGLTLLVSPELLVKLNGQMQREIKIDDNVLKLRIPISLISIVLSIYLFYIFSKL